MILRPNFSFITKTHNLKCQTSTFEIQIFLRRQKNVEAKLTFAEFRRQNLRLRRHFFFPFIFFDINTEISVIIGSASLILYIYVMSSFSYSFFYLFKGVKWCEFYGVTAKHFFQPFLRNRNRSYIPNCSSSG